MRFSENHVIAACCRADLKTFIKTLWDTVIPEKLVWNWHMGVIADELQYVAERIFKGLPVEHHLAINVCPSSSKSTIFSVMFPAWCWTRMPSFRYIGASYAEDLAMDLSRKCRDVVKSELYRELFSDVRIRSDQDNKTYFMTMKGGVRYSVGANGTVQGMHFHFIGIDDPLDPNRAISDAVLTQTNDWIKSTLSGRKIDHRITVEGLIMQRLHQDDPTAQMVERPNVRWIRIPATDEYEIHPPELKRFYVNGLMDPIRLPRSVLNEKKSPTGIGEFRFAGQYGENPVPAGGGMFKTDQLRFGPLPQKWKKLIRYWDKAASFDKSKSRAAFTVGALGGIDEDDREWVIDVKRFRLDSAMRERIIRRTAFKDGHKTIIGLEIEAAGAGKESAERTLRRLRGFSVRLVPARGSKELRADDFSVHVNNGQVWLPENFRQGPSWIGWAKETVDELRHWPHSTYKDIGDALSGLHNLLTAPAAFVGTLRGTSKAHRRH